ncbi:hypothetical protein E1180_14465 [Roseibium denhamense]|uniref:Uncharacterized protein n=1 Tax=Roseibium denhamense TaxID=76305 RepID=A0ABY1NIH9_9HYPH|nr:hypothetical protein [Roseibium denhamense]MTI06717.1 hypothetical protein [Roseibium denhamense]SMP10531.1 hypothetical protein SAMN06265374_1240 [Roseibium denhamense]
MKLLVKAAFAAALSLSAGTALAGDTVRILQDEPYGAVVTKEAGVLVFRALPPTRKVIVNPEGKTPLNLNFTEVNETNVVVWSQGEYVKQRGPKIIRLK